MRTPSGSVPVAYDPEESYGPPRGVSEQSRTVCLLLAIFGGVFGLHRFYLGRWKSGVGMAVTFGGLGMWWVYDLVLIGSGELRDALGQRVQSWDPNNPLPPSSSPDTAYLTERIEALEHDVNQMAERLDFTERMLTQDRERRSLPPTP